MHVDLTPDQRALQTELRTYFRGLMTPEVKAKIRGSEETENKDYKAAVARAERALVLDPASTEARQVLDQAQRTAAELEAVALEARRAFAAGDTNHATRALARVLALDPRHPVAGELTGKLERRGKVVYVWEGVASPTQRQTMYDCHYD